jgi:hypothetical protein
MNTTATVTLKSGAKVVVSVTTLKIQGHIKAIIGYRDIRVYASGPSESTAIKAAHEKFTSQF